MAATTEFRVFHGAAPGLGADVTNQTLRFKQADDDVQDASAPVPIPADGFGLSWRKSFKLVAVTQPDVRISNLRFYSDGTSLGVGRRVLFARSSAYVQASVADESAKISDTNVDDFTSVLPEVIQAGTVMDSSDSFPFDGGALQDYVMLQLEASVDALAGVPGVQKTVVYRYDEV